VPGGASPFAFACGIAGFINREPCAANIFVGHFAAEAMYIAESAFLARAVQIAGTTNMYQLPYLVAACDYVLIGEEMFAASAYVSKDAEKSGSLAGQDIGKMVAVGAILIGALLRSAGMNGVYDFLTKYGK